MPTAELPNRSLFKALEVCEIAQLQPYVLRSWEAEFPDLGMTRAGARVYRRGDVERVLRLKHLLFVEGLTLAGARRRLEEEKAPLPSLEDEAGGEAGAHGASTGAADAALRRQLSEVRRGLRSLLEMLDTRDAAHGGFELQAAPAHRGGKKTDKRAKGAVKSKSKRQGH